MEEQGLIDRYKCAKNLDIKLIDMDITSLAGYYLYNYPGDPISALLVDMHDLNVPSTVGQSAKVMITAILSKKKLSL